MDRRTAASLAILGTLEDDQCWCGSTSDVEEIF
jgi:hypothetical protein